MILHNGPIEAFVEYSIGDRVHIMRTPGSSMGGKATIVGIRVVHTVWFETTLFNPVPETKNKNRVYYTFLTDDNKVLKQDDENILQIDIHHKLEEENNEHQSKND